MGHEFEMAFDAFVVFMMISTPMVKPHKMFSFPVRNFPDKLKFVEDPLSLLFRPTIFQGGPNEL
jgi:hypothetical protein